MIKVIESLRLGVYHIEEALRLLEEVHNLSEEFDDLVFKALERDDTHLDIGLDELPPMLRYIIDILNNDNN